MVGRDVLFRVEKEAAQAGRADPRDRRTSRSRTTAGCRRCAGSRCRCAPARSSASPASTATASPSWSRRSPACASRAAATSASAARDITGTGVRGALAAGVGHIAEDRHRRGLVLDFTLAENLALREYRRAPPRFGLLSPKRMDAAGAAAARAVRRARRAARDAGRLAVGRQPAEGRDRARAGRGAAGHRRRAADARARRRRDRVRPPAAARAARRRAAACCSSRSSSRRSARWPTACS